MVARLMVACLTVAFAQHYCAALSPSALPSALAKCSRQTVTDIMVTRLMVTHLTVAHLMVARITVARLMVACLMVARLMVAHLTVTFAQRYCPALSPSALPHASGLAQRSLT
jgi:hypothetical protein